MNPPARRFVPLGRGRGFPVIHGAFWPSVRHFLSVRPRASSGPMRNIRLIIGRCGSRPAGADSRPWFSPCGPAGCHPGMGTDRAAVRPRHVCRARVAGRRPFRQRATFYGDFRRSTPRSGRPGTIGGPGPRSARPGTVGDGPGLTTLPFWGAGPVFSGSVHGAAHQERHRAAFCAAARRPKRATARDGIKQGWDRPATGLPVGRPCGMIGRLAGDGTGT